jgi:hypothetical protein
MAKTLFDHINHIFEQQKISYFDELEESDKKTYNVYMVSRFISMNPDYLPIVNELQQYWGQIGPRESYLFFSQALPKKKQFNKYIKSTKDASDYEDWVVKLVAKHYMVSTSNAEEYLRTYYGSVTGKEALKELLSGYGIDPKQLRKAHLG